MAVRRYQLEHPVINDGNFQVWQQYSCRAWPTLMFIDPLGNVIGKHEGEMSFEAFDNLMTQMVTEFDSQGILTRTPIDTFYVPSIPTLLSFPGKVLADEYGDRLFIADTNHNRIVVTTLDGSVIQVIGSGDEDLADGDFTSCSFNHPQGMTPPMTIRMTVPSTGAMANPHTMISGRAPALPPEPCTAENKH